MPYIPHELIAAILAHLPVESLMRFSCVCKAWRSTISSDPSFHRAHLRLQAPFLLLSPHTLREDRLLTDKVVFYRWEDSQRGAAAPLVYATHLCSHQTMHGFAHCDGLVMLPMEAAVHVLNPATRRTLTLPWSPRAERPPLDEFESYIFSHQAFGFGHDPRSNTYKVARFFYRSMCELATGGYRYTTGMEVFTIGTDRQWRDIREYPPYPIVTPGRQPAAFFKGSLVWKIDESILGHVPPGFLLFLLEDEAFRVMPAPTCYREMEHDASVLVVLRGELCLARHGADINTIEMWMCDDIKNAKWEQRYKIKDSTHMLPVFKPIAIFDDQIVFKELNRYTIRYDIKTKAYNDVFHMEDSRYQYHSPVTCMLGYQRSCFSYFDVIPYVPSLVPV